MSLDIDPRRVKQVADKIETYKQALKTLRASVNLRGVVQEKLQRKVQEFRGAETPGNQPPADMAPAEQTSQQGPAFKRPRLLQSLFPGPEPQIQPAQPQEVDELRAKVQELEGELKRKEKLERENRIGVEPW